MGMRRRVMNFLRSLMLIREHGVMDGGIRVGVWLDL